MKRIFLLLGIGLFVSCNTGGSSESEAELIKENDVEIETITEEIESSAQDLEKEIEEIDSELDEMLNEL